MLSGCGTSRDFLVVKYSATGEVIDSYHLKGSYPTISEGVTRFYVDDGEGEKLIRLTGNVDVIETTNQSVDEIKESLGIKK